MLLAKVSENAIQRHTEYEVRRAGLSRKVSFRYRTYFDFVSCIWKLVLSFFSLEIGGLLALLDDTKLV